MSKASQSFAPIQIMELEIGRPLPEIRPGNDTHGRPYERALALIRLHGQPIGAITFDLLPSGTDIEALAALVWDTLRTEVTAHLRADGVPDGVRDLPLFSRSHDAKESSKACIVARNDFLGSAPFASIVIATRNRPDTLARCLESLARLEYPDYEVIVVDNAPANDATKQFFAEHYAHRPNVRYVREDWPGLASAHNRGVREMSERSRFVAFTDDDVVFDHYWLCELMRGFGAAANVGCVTGMIFPAELETWPQMLIEQFGGFSKGFHRQLYDIGANRPDDPLFPFAAGRFGSGANMAFRTETLEQIGGFDPALGTGTPALGGDDLAAFFRVVTDGYTLVYEPAAIVHHAHYRDYAALQRQIYGYGVGLTAYLTKSIVDRPRLLLDVATKAPTGVSYVLKSGSAKNAKKGPGYPVELTTLERRGMFYGPIAYLRSRLAARRFIDAVSGAGATASNGVGGQ